MAMLGSAGLAAVSGGEVLFKIFSFKFHFKSRLLLKLKMVLWRKLFILFLSKSLLLF